MSSRTCRCRHVLLWAPGPLPGPSHSTYDVSATRVSGWLRACDKAFNSQEETLTTIQKHTRRVLLCLPQRHAYNWSALCCHQPSVAETLERQKKRQGEKKRERESCAALLNIRRSLGRMQGINWRQEPLRLACTRGGLPISSLHSLCLLRLRLRLHLPRPRLPCSCSSAHLAQLLSSFSCSDWCLMGLEALWAQKKHLYLLCLHLSCFRSLLALKGS